jgi:nucleotide-binding universal stress UspA family protein/quercetin dioxygenase-like cupin family protein
MLGKISSHAPNDWPYREDRTMPGIQRILHPTDFSENSRPAFQTACALARDYDATLFVLHVMMPSVSLLMRRPPLDLLRSAESQGSGAQLPWPQPSGPPVRMEHRLTEGDPVEEILRCSEALRCDLVVMAARGKSRLERFWTGSVAEEVLRGARCGVLVVNTPRPATTDAEPEMTANPGDPIDVRPLGTSLVSAQTRTLVRTAAVEVVRLIVRAGQEIPPHQSRGEIIVHCLEGRVAFTTLGKMQTLETGKLLELPAGEPHAFQGIEDASLLLTILAPRH